jgi:hypothetical protein
MNVRRLAAPLAIGGIAVCAAAVALTVAGAFGIRLFESPPEGAAAAGETVGVDAEEAGASAGEALTIESFVSEPVTIEERSEYMGREQIIAECMAEQGVEYLPAAPWLNQDAQPQGLSFEQSLMWLNAFYGESRESWSVPASEWERRGCVGVGDHAVAVARAAGTPLSAPVPEPEPSAPSEAEEWAAFQESIRSCMTEQGFGEFDDGTGAWSDAMYGDAGTGAAYRWEDAGCSGYATHVTGNDNMH